MKQFSKISIEIPLSRKIISYLRNAITISVLLLTFLFICSFSYKLYDVGARQTFIDFIVDFAFVMEKANEDIVSNR